MNLIKRNSRKKDPIDIGSIANGNTLFALDLYKKLSVITEGNIFFSPYSISVALAMTYAGACGKTQSQMVNALHFPQDQEQLQAAFAQLRLKIEEVAKKGCVQLKSANALWPMVGFDLEKEYVTLIKKSYGVQITSIDYKDEETARKTINTWVEEQTASKIKDLIGTDVLDSLTRLVLVNAIYFKGEWKNGFELNDTKELPFWVSPSEEIQLPIMTQVHTFKYGEAEDLQILELPYFGEEVSMVILLPNKSIGLAKLEELLNDENLNKWLQNLTETEVKVFVPRFEMNFPFRLDETLKSLGMLDAFSDNADFSAMERSKGLYIGAVLHKAYV